MNRYTFARRALVAATLLVAAVSALAHPGHAGSGLPGHGHGDVELLAAAVVGTIWAALAVGALAAGLRRLLARR